MSVSWDDIEARARQRFPERYAPNSEPLVGYANECRHTSDERTRGLCGDAWQHRRAAWEHAQLRAQAPTTTTEDVEGPPIADEPEYVDDQDAPYERVRGQGAGSNVSRDVISARPSIVARKTVLRRPGARR